MQTKVALQYVIDYAKEIAFAAKAGDEKAQQIISAYKLYYACSGPGSAFLLCHSVENFQGNKHHLPDGTYIGPTLEDLS